MLHDLKFVRGAVAKKDYQPSLTHFLIKGGRVIGYDGVIALSSPIDLDIEAAPKAEKFVKAIERCTDETTSVNLTGAGRITLKSGRFRATIECVDDTGVLDSIQPEGEDMDVPQLIMALQVLEPFIGTDASRPWSNGILLRGQCAYATNNIIIGEYFVGSDLPEINIPSSAIRELNRIGKEPDRIQLSKTSVTFHFGDRWLRSQLLASTWPDIESLLEQTFTSEKNLLPIPVDFFNTIETLKPFMDQDSGIVYFRDGIISTSLDGDVGGAVEIDGLPDHGAYHHKQLALLQKDVTQIDFTTHPKPCPFLGSEHLRGIFIGMVDA